MKTQDAPAYARKFVAPTEPLGTPIYDASGRVFLGLDASWVPEFWAHYGRDEALRHLAANLMHDGSSPSKQAQGWARSHPETTAYIAIGAREGMRLTEDPAASWGVLYFCQQGTARRISEKVFETYVRYGEHPSP